MIEDPLALLPSPKSQVILLYKVEAVENVNVNGEQGLRVKEKSFLMGQAEESELAIKKVKVEVVEIVEAESSNL